MDGNSIDHLHLFIQKIKNHEPLSIIRPNDGEFMILQGYHFTNIDNWTFMGGIQEEANFLGKHIYMLRDSPPTKVRGFV